MESQVTDITSIDTENQSPNSIERKPWQWKPGQSGNPNGRPKKENCLTSLLKDSLELEENGRTNAQIIMQRLMQLAKAGEPWAIKEVLDRVEGKAKQSLDIESDTVISVTYTNPYVLVDDVIDQE